MPHPNVSDPEAAAGAPRFDVACLGESMVTFRPTGPGRLADVPSFDRGIGGAESNVACTLARAGHSARWVGRVGADGFGEYLTREIAACGVDTSAVRADAGRPTGIYFRTAGDRATDAHEVAYYRAGSAASAMSVANMDLDALRSARIVHLSGITAALSADCLGLLRELTAPRPGRPLVSFDVNYRPGLWSSPADARVLLELARGADLVFVGEDEAEEAWGLTGGPAAIRATLPEPATLVVKQGALGAAVRGEDAPDGVHEPAPAVEVVAAVGAGDAFAAGFLSATLRGLPAAQRLRHGHLWAAAALTVPGDMAEPPGRAQADRLAALPDAEWGTLRLGPGWTMSGVNGEVVTK
ncbi:sugar kinase [Streptomyces indicus]|uniref:2-dehydro-3-deoxygluconokinase n=1 Tax=Streptomyces indicus TaxID=417292 RepID=A0A1G9BJ39_9ACTN|nr:sugar kinase [Streptomyces indicus]SDK39502.1 2-dehydro-3-deoxygluconokinase [Streptomyces indicus]